MANVLITGGSRGIGAACVRRFAQKRVIVTLVKRPLLVIGGFGRKRGHNTEPVGAKPFAAV